MNAFLTRWFAVCLIPLLVSCGGGGNGAAAVPAAQVMRVEIEQTGLLMTAAGETRVLTARAFDAQGLELAVALTWSSTAPGAIFVDAASGQVVAGVANGSAQITASAQGRVSAPLLAVVTPLAAGVRPIADAEVVRAAQAADPLAEPDPANAYTVILDTATPVAVGERLVSTGSQAVVGEVLAVEPATPGQQVTLRLVPLSELLPALDLDLDLDLSEAPIELNPDIAERYTMIRDRGRVQLTPRPGLAPTAAGKVAASGFAPATARRAAVARPAGTFAFDRGCEVAIDGGADGSLPITFDVAPTFDIAINPSLEVLMDDGNLQGMIVRAAPRIVLDAELRTTLAFQGKVECKAELFRIRLPIGGAFSFVLGGLIPVGFGAELAGQVTVGNVTMGYRSTTTGTLTAGLDCSADCEVLADVSISNVSEPRLTPPNGDFGDNLRFKPALFGFAFAEVVFGNPFLRSLQFNGLVGKFGAKFEGDFASIDTQIADPAYASTYGIAVACELGPDLDLNRAVELLFGSATFIPKKFECGFPPFTQLPRLSSATSNLQSWVDGDEVLIDVRFDPASLDFIPGVGLENLSTVNLIRLDSSGRAAVVASATESSANPGAVRLRFLAGETPNGVFRAGNVDELFVTYITSLLPLSSLRLEAGKVTASPPPGRIGFGGASVNASGGATACKNESDEACRLGEPPNTESFVETSFIASDRDSGGAGGSQAVSRSANVEDGDQAAEIRASASASASGAGNVRTFTASCNSFAEVTEERVQADKSDATGGSSVSFSLDLPPGSSFSIALSGVTTTASDPAYASAATVQVRFRSDAEDSYRFERSAAGVLSSGSASSGIAEGEASFGLNCSTFPVNRLNAGQLRSQATATLTVTAPP